MLSGVLLCIRSHIDVMCSASAEAQVRVMMCFLSLIHHLNGVELLSHERDTEEGVKLLYL